MLIPYCFDYYSFVIWFEIRECDGSSFALLSQNYFGYLGSFVVPQNHCCFNLHFPDDIPGGASFQCLFAIYIYSSVYSQLLIIVVTYIFLLYVNEESDQYFF